MIVYGFDFIDYYITFFFFNQESKRAFFYSIVTEGGEKGKLEAFVNFCEDAIFEVITLIAHVDDMTSLRCHKWDNHIDDQDVTYLIHHVITRR